MVPNDGFGASFMVYSNLMLSAPGIDSGFHQDPDQEKSLTEEGRNFSVVMIEIQNV